MGWHGKVFRSFEEFWTNLRRFCSYNRTIFEIIFIFLYAAEQGMLIIFTYNARSIQELSAIVSIFAIIVLTTFSLHKVLMESRIKDLERRINDMHEEKARLEVKATEILQRYKGNKSIYEEMNSKDLNKQEFS